MALPAPPTLQELRSLLPWAEMDTDTPYGELVIYTGIILNENDDTEWMEGMKENG